MRNLFVFILISLTAVMVKAETFFESCENIPGITTVYVSKAMISLAGDLNIKSDNIDFNSIAANIEGLWVITAEDNEAKILKDKAKTAFKDNGYEKLMSVREDGETVDILMRSLGSNKNECVIKAFEEDETTIVIITGSFTLQAIAHSVKADR